MKATEPLFYTCFCIYSLRGNAYAEYNKDFRLAATNLEILVKKIQAQHTLYQDPKWYIGTTELKKESNTHYSFESAYIYGPKVHYDIYINPFYKEDLGFEIR
jgi:hypothetical protein